MARSVSTNPRSSTAAKPDNHSEAGSAPINENKAVLWTVSHYKEELHLLVANRDELERVVYGSWWGSLLYRARHALNRNSRRGSAKNIHAHYDIGNSFYTQWLGPTMSYSSAWFEGDMARPLEEAQQAKLRRALHAFVE